MTEFALAHEPGPEGDRLDVADHDGRPVGWVDLGSGRRVVFQASQGAAFDAAVDLWFDAVGDNATSQWRGATPVRPGSHQPLTDPLQVTETRFVDPEVVRTLVMPLLPIR
jgi:hypothetical protein